MAKITALDGAKIADAVYEFDDQVFLVPNVLVGNAYENFHVRSL